MNASGFGNRGGGTLAAGGALGSGSAGAPTSTGIALADLTLTYLLLDEADTSLEALEVRRRSGVATVADLYQAQSNVAQAVLAVDRDRGAV